MAQEAEIQMFEDFKSETQEWIRRNPQVYGSRLTLEQILQKLCTEVSSYFLFEMLGLREQAMAIIV